MSWESVKRRQRSIEKRQREVKRLRFEEGYTWTQIAKEMGISMNILGRDLKELKLIGIHYQRPTNKEQMAMELRQSGYDWTVIGKSLKCSRNTARARVLRGLVKLDPQDQMAKNLRKLERHVPKYCTVGKNKKPKRKSEGSCHPKKDKD